jgi:calcineurin-like phosphoesterase family protein
MTRWEKSHFGAWHLFGHVHSEWCPADGKVMNITLDALKNYPISFEYVCEYMKNRSDNLDFIRRK